MENKEHQRVYERIISALMLGAAITLLVALISSLWRFLAAQSPSSPLHLGPLLGPIESLSYACWVAGFGGLAVAAIMRSSDFDRRAAKKISTALVVGWVLLLSGLILGAVLGTYGTQVIKAYPRTVVVLIFKLLGFVSIGYGLVLLLIIAVGRFLDTGRG